MNGDPDARHANTAPCSAGMQKECQLARLMLTLYMPFAPPASTHKKKADMSDHLVVLKLNQQQLELLDRTVARGVAADHGELIRLALREYAGKHPYGSQPRAGTQAGENK
ncbi:MAG: hypothetical protein JWP38_1589 [Herbaspirillum sp.]|jgi:hypothetical protein|nr:hypothetical protein [Herbaspirillum sp.]